MEIKIKGCIEEKEDYPAGYNYNGLLVKHHDNGAISITHDNDLKEDFIYIYPSQKADFIRALQVRK